METAYRFALTCGAVPLVAGLGFYLFWLITRLEPLTKMVPSVILMSLLMVFFGFAALTRFGWEALRRRDLPRERVWRAIIIAASLLSANLPVTAGLLGQILAKTTASG